VTASVGDVYGIAILAPPTSIKTTWINVNQRLHWSERARRTREWRLRAKLAAQNAGIPRMQRAHIEAVVTFGDCGRRDVANYYPTAKACVDAVVDVGILPDDDDMHLIGPFLRRYDTPADRRLGPLPRGIVLQIAVLELP
jgi:hypothetical protein